MTGAIFCERRPATIMRSAWRGEGRKTSAPKRATSKRDAAMDIISMAQQARPKPSGQMELLRAQFTALSSVRENDAFVFEELAEVVGLGERDALA